MNSRCVEREPDQAAHRELDRNAADAETRHPRNDGELKPHQSESIQFQVSPNSSATTRMAPTSSKMARDKRNRR